MNAQGGPASVSDAEIRQALLEFEDKSELIYNEENRPNLNQDESELAKQIALKAFKAGQQKSFFLAFKSRSYVSETTKDGQPITRANVYLFYQHQWRMGSQDLSFVKIEEPSWTLFKKDSQSFSEKDWKNIRDLFIAVPD
jgi:hypothetical protein